MKYVFKRSDVFNFASFINAETIEKGDELFFKFCPRCNGGAHRDKDTFSVNLETGGFKCFRSSCGYQGHFVELARDFDFDLGFGEKRVYKPLPQKSIEIRPAAFDYMATRGISETTCRRYFITTQKDNRNILVFPFYDDKGILQFVKYRNVKHKKGDRGNKEWCEKNTMPIPFGMFQCKGYDRLIITEGQIDSLSVAECGIENAVSVPTGAQGFTWLLNCREWIDKFQEVIVFGDNEHGSITLVDQLKALLKQTIKVVRRQDYLGEKDANDILLNYGKQAIVTAIQNAEVPKLENIKDLSTVKAVDLNKLPKIRTMITPVDRTIGGLIMGQVVLLSGKRGNGKSTFMSQLVCEALDQGENVLVYSGELADYHFKRWLDYQLAGEGHVNCSTNLYGDMEYSMSNDVVEKISAWYRGRAYIYDNNWIPDGDETESLPQTIEKAIVQYGIRMVCIDNLMTAMDAVNDNAQLNLAQSNFVGKLKKIAVKYNIVIILVAHPRKSQNDFSNDDVSGSSDITNKVDVVMSYQRVDDAKDGHNGKLLITKNRLTGKYAIGDNAIPLLYSDMTKRITEPGSIQRHYGWEDDFEPTEEEEFFL